ncbi:MAG: hypothetical protein PHR45_01160 [Muribaculaceae bacterium]|nr:hypothetical protein [Muribaculaceae bacterium]
MEQNITLNEHNKEEYPPMHTAEHILNGTMAQMWGCGRAVNCHIERKKSKCDYAMPIALPAEQIAEVENRVNEIIAQNIDITMEFATKGEVATRFDMERLPDDASEMVRIVKIGDYDECLCVGTHVANTKEIGAFRISSTRYQDGIFRIVFRLDTPT